MVRTINLHATTQQGRRESNEDVELFRLNLSTRAKPIDNRLAPIDFFIICDGHGGSRVAELVAPKLRKIFTRKDADYPIRQNEICKIFDIIQGELENNFRNESSQCGCTSLILIRYADKVGKENIQVINLGDCRAVMSRNGLAIPLTKDHKPFWPDEKIRINNVNKSYSIDYPIHFDAGDWRIHDLSVSRSFGDIDATPHVTHIPECFNYPLSKKDEFIVLACDGLWDVMQNHEVINFIRDHINNNNIEFYDIYGRYPSPEVRSSKCIARKLASYAIARGSTDNISIFILFFGN